jgi:uncharacterized membrane protein
MKSIFWGVALSMTAAAKIILVHGTWGRGFDPDKGAQRKAAGESAERRWFEAGSKFCEALSSGLSGLVQATDLSAFLWSGANSIEERRSAAVGLAKTLDEGVAAAPNARHFIIAHSHGGNVALDARQAMSRDAHNVNIITLATPFLSIYDIVPGILDRLFAICLSIGVAILASYAFWKTGMSDDATFAGLLYASYLFPLLSIIFGVVTFFSWARRFRKSEFVDQHRSNAFELAKHVNNLTLLTSGLLLGVGSYWFAFDVASLLLPFVVPGLFVLFFSITTASRFLYGARYAVSNLRRDVPNLTIPRSPRDEASLALFFGKITSLLSHIAASVSIVVPIAAVVLAALVLGFVAYILVGEYWHYQDCVTNGRECNILGESLALLLLAALKFGAKCASYLVFGVFICVAFVLLAAACKSLFGRELLYRSLNATVDVYDTPDGSKSYSVEWCASSKENAFGLRHSLYNNPDAVKKIIVRINHVVAAGLDRNVPAVAAQPDAAPRSAIWRTAAAFAVVAATYAIAVSWTYAPPGASGWCAWNSYFEPSAPKGDFTILVARFDNDAARAGDRLAAEVSRQYGLPVMRTCVHVTANDDDSSSAGTLLRRYNADLLLSGTVVKGGQIALQMSSGGGLATTSTPITLTQDTIPQVVAKQLQSFAIAAIEDSALKVSSSEPAANLADFADRVDAFVKRIDWTDDPSASDKDKSARLAQRIGMNAAAGLLMLGADLAAKGGARVKKAVEYFAAASSACDGLPDPKPFVRYDWDGDYSFALLTDARLNKAQESAQLAASRYSKAYQDSVNNLTGEGNDQLYQRAELAASAHAELYSITQSQDAEQSTIRLACESMLRLRFYNEDMQARESHPSTLARQGLSQGNLPTLPPPEQTDAYKLLVSFGKDPSVIFKPSRACVPPETCGRRPLPRSPRCRGAFMELEDCAKF